jgi:diguanylate cyclase (GGDEF)-like protein
MDETRDRILIVDDESINLQILNEVLRARYDISAARSGEQALKRAQTLKPSLILLDIQMPEMDGYEVCRRLKQDPETRDIPVIFITGMTSEEDEYRGLEAGAVDYITKPFRPAIIEMRVRTHVELKRQRDLLNRLSYHDGLTGIANRRRFDEFYTQAWHQAARSEDWLGLLLLDIDHFKGYNDRYGHPAGDACLRDVARALAQVVCRSSDLHARYGGEEFACVLPCTDPEGVALIAERICQAVRALGIPHEASSAAPFVTVSIGAAALKLDKTSLDPSALVSLADDLLYRAKESGRNRVVTIKK